MRGFINFATSIMIYFILLMLAISFISCDSQKNQGHVEHIVLVWLKNPGNEDDIKKVIGTTNELKEINGIISLRVGTAVPSEREIVDDSFDVGIVMTFGSIETMKSYLTDARHVERVNNILGPLSDKIIVYDVLY